MELLIGFDGFWRNKVAPSDGTFTARELFSYHETPTAEVYTDKDVVVQCEDPKKVGSHYHCATVEGNCNVAVKVAGVFEFPMKGASFVATTSKMYSIINATGTFLMPSSGQMLVRLPTSTMLDIGGVKT